MAHCSRCLIPWGANDGMYLKEVDRVLRPGGYWVLSGPPINWRNNYKAWQRPKEELEEAEEFKWTYQSQQQTLYQTIRNH